MSEAEPGADAAQREIAELRAHLTRYETGGSRHIPRIRARSVALAALAITFLIGVDWGLQVIEMRSLVATVEQVQGLERSRLGALVKDLEQTRNSSRPQDQEQGRVGARIKAQLLMEQMAPEADQMRSMHVAPWHGSIRRARSRYLDRYEAMHRLLKDIADDPSRPVSTSDVGTTWASAKPALLNAVPRWAGGLRKRVQDLTR